MANLTARMNHLCRPWAALSVTVLTVTILWTGMQAGADDDKASEVESRGTPQIQRPTKPGTPLAPGAQGQQKFQLPTWPQKFAVEDRKPASLGFAVTQAGPLVVDVQWQGPSLEATLRGPIAQPIVQRGQGQLRVTYQVAPQDVQRGVLWVVTLTLPSNTKGQATGQVTVQHPAVNEAQAETAVRARVSQAQQHTKLSPAELQAHTQAILTAHKNEDARQYQQYIKDTALQADAILKQKGFQGQIQSRALKPPRDSASQSSKLPPGAQSNLQAFVPPPPHIDSLSVTYASPGANVVIQGSGFTNKIGTVLMSTTNAAVQPQAKVVQGPSGPIWSDTLIEVTVPELTGVTVFNSNLFVVVEGDPATGPQISNWAPFLFTPRQQTRVFSMVSPIDHRLATSTGPTELGGFGTEGGVAGEDINHSRIVASLFFNPDIFFGHDGHDRFYENTTLQNGWRVTCVEVIPFDLHNCRPGNNTVYGIPPGTGAYIYSVNQNAGPIKLDVRWWFDAFIPFMSYKYVFVIRGPENVPDGLLCFTVAACSAP
jgi:hypothetical protein